MLLLIQYIKCKENKLNSLSLKNVQLKKFPVVKILNLLPSKSSLFETALVAANDELVNLYLKNKIRYNDISSLLIKEISKKYIMIMKKNFQILLILN